ncbi:hypothetical protein Cgig2_021785 [Carnegiea gigantea]|uniref:Retropepsins domain-containing protein n=1 Tax=Carnegiea gigantea TaxID=171969 RepID=A0A9Q1GR55_9CARY|nr:hypothetical protein Cgig2_021785 [Carnegiea gigantea]
MGRESQPVHWDRCRTQPPPEPGMAGKVNHNLTAISNTLPKNRLVRGAGANLETLRGSFRTILIDTGSLVDIITCDCLKKLKYLGRQIAPLVHPIFGFGIREVNPIGIIRLSLCFGDKVKARSLEIDFLVVNVSTTYNIVVGWPTLHNVKAVIARYLLQL